MNKKVKSGLISLISLISIFILFAGIAGYYVVNTINDIQAHKQWWYDLLVIVIVLWEVAYASMHIWQINHGEDK
ncbi:Kef-type K+ transport system membrane component KefB [Lactobacillus colini]|uniref:Kef-type K+ transport system membrane component KefB n=1 Tax=Lactobacillus colini TaxID=1819254 RepID=A0ABS4MFE1_9LACO|nr:hypothetical protein [Lactobacillus colini]MBP2058082.1 Kef-type K+ transport system membrane component KefB [Lactobacillus colini]